MIEVRAKLRHVRISPKKVRLVTNFITGKSVNEALSLLPVVFKRSSLIVTKLLQSAVANAKDRYGVSADDLKIKTIIVNKATDLKRWRPAAFGQAHPYKKHSAHIEIVLAISDSAKIVAKEVKQPEIETVDLTKTENKKVESAETKGEGKKFDKKNIKQKITSRVGGIKKERGKVKTG